MKFCRENYRIARIAFTTLPIRMWWLDWLFPGRGWLLARCCFCCCLHRPLWFWGLHLAQDTGGYRLRWCHQGPGPARLPDSPSAELRTARLGDSRSGRVSTKEGCWWIETTFWQLIGIKVRYNRGGLNRQENSCTLQQTQKALSGFRPSQPLFPASRKRFMNSVYSARWTGESRTKMTCSSLAGSWSLRTSWPRLEATRGISHNSSSNNNNRLDSGSKCANVCDLTVNSIIFTFSKFSTWQSTSCIN